MTPTSNSLLLVFHDLSCYASLTDFWIADWETRSPCKLSMSRTKPFLHTPFPLPIFSIAFDNTTIFTINQAHIWVILSFSIHVQLSSNSGLLPLPLNSRRHSTPLKGLDLVSPAACLYPYFQGSGSCSKFPNLTTVTSHSPVSPSFHLFHFHSTC